MYISGIPGAELDVALGYTQYAFSNHMTNLAEAYVYAVQSDVSSLITSCVRLLASALPPNLSNWSPENLDAYRVATYDFFIYRKAHSSKTLSRISCPVKVLHGASSVVYPLDYTERFMESLHEGGVDASLATIPNAPHYMCIDHGNVLVILSTKYRCCNANVRYPESIP